MSIVKNKNSRLVILIVITCVIAVGVLYKSIQKGAVYTRTVTTEEGPLLSEPIQKWLEDRRLEPKISAYAYDKDGIYELILVDNRNGRENQYIKTDVKTKQWGNKLYLEFVDTQAVSESDVQYNQETYIILKEKPSEIELTVNGEKQLLLPETGDVPITQP